GGAGAVLRRGGYGLRCQQRSAGRAARQRCVWPAAGEWRGPSDGDGPGPPLIADVLATVVPLAYEAGMTPPEVRQSTLAELTAYIQASARRLVQAHEARVWMTANLMLATGNFPRTLTLRLLMHDLLGRDPSGAAPEELSPEAKAGPLQARVQALDPSTAC